MKYFKIICLTAVFLSLLSCPNGGIGTDDDDEYYTVSFYDDGNLLDTVSVTPGGLVPRPDDPHRAGEVFTGWFQYGDYGNVRWNFADPLYDNLTLFAEYSWPVTSIDGIRSHIEGQGGGYNSSDNPIILPMSIHLGNMTQDGSGWHRLLQEINSVGSYVDLNLSICTMNGTEFNPDPAFTAGKRYIVSITLPGAAVGIADGTSLYPAFSGFDNLRSFYGSGLQTIGDFAFKDTASLSMPELPRNITSIGEYAFQNCYSLALRALPAGLTSIGMRAFEACADLALTELPAGLTTIEAGVFYDCLNLALTELPAGLTSIGNSAFYNCISLALTSLPSALNSIGSYAFLKCINLDFDTLPSGLASIGEGAFYQCNGMDITIPANVTAIGRWAFAYWSPAQTITVQRPNQAAADAEWGENWRQFCYASISYTDGNPPPPNDPPIDPPPDPPADPITITMEMVPVPGGTFELGKHLGSASGGDRTNMHSVTLTSFSMGKYQVTQEQYQAVMGDNPSSGYGVGANYPVYNVSWYDAIEFCNKLSEIEGLSPYYNINKNQTDPNNNSDYDTYKWLVTVNSTATGYRLPTEAQWEYAAKGGDPTASGWVGYTYSGSDDPDDVAWHLDNIPSQTDGDDGYGTQPVGTKQPNGLGLYDMSGNVFEWCWDWWGNYTADAKNNPTGALSGDTRIGRGGSWQDLANLSLSNIRANYDPIGRGIYYGFRVLRP